MLNGTQQFTSAVVAYCQNHKVELLIEDPTYNLMVGAMRTFAHVVKTVKRTIQGLDLDALEAMAKNGEFKFFFTMAHNHNPLGTSLSKEEKTRLIDLARRYDFYIIEDDYLKDLSTKEESLFAMAPDVVIYLRSFSKTVSPSLRLCALIIPPALVHDLGDTFGFLNTGASSLNQDVLLRYLKSKASEKHNRLLRERTSEKCQTLKKALKDCPYPYYVPDCGLYAYIELPEGFRTMELLEVMDDKDMRFRSDLEFSFNRDINGLRISLSRVEKRAIETAIPVLIQEMKQITTALPQSKDIYL